jgi:transcription antitermination factor NusG
MEEKREDKKEWFVLNTKPKKEFQVEKLFQEGGIEFYCPRYKQESRKKPFFSGYGFIRFAYPSQYRLVRYTRGVKRVIGNQEGPIPIPEEIILQIKQREINGYIELEKYGEIPEIGDEIEIMEGPMKGLKGIFRKELTDKERVVILLNYVSYQGQLIIEKKKLKKVVT